MCCCEATCTINKEELQLWVQEYGCKDECVCECVCVCVVCCVCVCMCVCVSAA